MSKNQFNSMQLNSIYVSDQVFTLYTIYFLCNFTITPTDVEKKYQKMVSVSMFSNNQMQ